MACGLAGGGLGIRSRTCVECIVFDVYRRRQLMIREGCNDDGEMPMGE